MLAAVRFVLSGYFADFCIVKREGYSIITAIAPYQPFTAGKFFLDAYYLHTNKIIGKTALIKQELTDAGIAVLPERPVMLKEIVAEGGLAFRGLNTLAISPTYGSRFFIIPFFIAGEYKLTGGSQKNCLRCGECIRACPTGALTGSGLCRDKCLRNIMMHPESMTKEIAVIMGNRIFGCDTCQTVCPHNFHLQAAENSEVDPAVERMLFSGDVAELQGMIGSNFAKYKRMMLMIINAAKNSGDIKYIDRLNLLKNDPEFNSSPFIQTF